MTEKRPVNENQTYDQIVYGIKSSREPEIRRLWWRIQHDKLEDNLKKIIKETPFASDYDTFRESLNYPGFLDMLTYWNSETISTLLKAAGNRSKNFKSFSIFLNDYKFNEFTKYFNTTEDLHGDNIYSDIQMNEALKKVKEKEESQEKSFLSDLLKSFSLLSKNSVPEQFKKIIDLYTERIFDRLNIVSNIYSGRPSNNPNQKRNSTLANKIQIERLKIAADRSTSETDKKFLFESIKLLETKKTEGRKLVLYVRKGHGEMDSLKFCAIAYMLNKYIVKEKRSPIFDDIQIVSYSEDFYPKQVHDLGIKKSKYLWKFGDKFKQLGLAGNMFFFNHSDASEQQLLQSVPIIPQSITSNPRKFIENDEDPEGKTKHDYKYSLLKSKYIPFQAFFDIRDDGNQAGYDKDSKDRGRSVEKMLRAAMWSVLSLENLILLDNNLLQDSIEN
jgi:hypothetical protein